MKTILEVGIRILKKLKNRIDNILKRVILVIEQTK